MTLGSDYTEFVVCYHGDTQVCIGAVETKRQYIFNTDLLQNCFISYAYFFFFLKADITCNVKYMAIFRKNVYALDSKTAITERVDHTTVQTYLVAG